MTFSLFRWYTFALQIVNVTDLFLTGDNFAGIFKPESEMGALHHVVLFSSFCGFVVYLICVFLRIEREKKKRILFQSLFLRFTANAVTNINQVLIFSLQFEKIPIHQMKIV